MAKSLRLNVFLVLLLGVLIPAGAGFYYFYQRQESNLEEAFLRQGRVMANQILITRRWLSVHGGVYVQKFPFVRESPFMDGANTATLQGMPIILRSPDLVTRELSELSVRDGMHSFRLVARAPVNPSNRPSEWEEHALGLFEDGEEEAFSTFGALPQVRFRYMVPIRTEASCHRCHQERGYKVGDVRGGISIEFPVGEMLAESREDLLGIGVLVLIIGTAILAISFIGTSLLVLRPVSELGNAIRAMAAGDYEHPLESKREDELGELSDAVISTRAVLRDYSRKLEEEVWARTLEIEKMRRHAQQERDFLITLFDRMADGVCVIKKDDHRIEYINPSLKAVFGAVEDQRCEDAFPGVSNPCPPEDGKEQPEGGRTEVSEPRSGRNYDVIVTTLANSDGKDSMLLVFRDITERKRLEAELVEINRTLEEKVREQTETLVEQEKLATLGEVSAGLAHEIRNPLSAILSGVSLLESPKRTSEETERIIRLIKKESKRLNTSLTDFLLFARPRDPQKVRIDLNGLVQDIVRLIEEDPDLKEKVEIELSLSKLPPVTFDDDQLRQVIWNVCLNAFQAMGGEGSIKISTAFEPEDMFRLTVTDSGPGIPRELSERIYNPFFSTKKGGTGLGLAIVRRIMKDHEGRIEHECGQGGGCTFSIVAPIGELAKHDGQ